MTKLKIVAILLLIILPHCSFAQPKVTNDIGIIAGVSEMRSDYGQRGETKSNINNMGFGIALVHYAGFSYFDNLNEYFKEHFKVRSELSYSKTKMQHYGEWVGKTSLTSKQLQAMRGSTQLFNVGCQLEYSLKNLHDFEREIGSFAPYVSIGPQFSYYDAKAWSTMGEIGTSLTTPLKYLIPSNGHPNGYSNESKTVFSATLNIGTRYKLTPLTDLVLDIRAQFFTSDWVDGLNPKKDLFKENKNNDWLTFIGLGYVIYLDN
ncbi:THC0290_0291 family protein [Flavobacterium gilvum]|uniref:Glutamate dehydrogenase n=1 Tax=Flavobacterium gilvum TaxID=1492737 RepID=A0AAC9N696_9FLAO|nr:hypothetical protein [Flavobacterium gilvum]AOW08608.1 hypothetical protein EM308_03350 [Flavobacterium gilvum]KFC59706.1 glutamate dehydrogenase [Flavobacterium gilvum]